MGGAMGHQLHVKDTNKHFLVSPFSCLGKSEGRKNAGRQRLSAFQAAILVAVPTTQALTRGSQWEYTTLYFSFLPHYLLFCYCKVAIIYVYIYLFQ